jgi:hypothetical protein
VIVGGGGGGGGGGDGREGGREGGREEVAGVTEVVYKIRQT